METTQRTDSVVEGRSRGLEARLGLLYSKGSLNPRQKHLAMRSLLYENHGRDLSLYDF